MPSKFDNAILHFLCEGKIVNKMGAVKIEDIPLDAKPNTIYRRLKMLCKAGLVGKGLLEVNASTYYITPKGIDFYKESIGYEEGI